VTFYCVILKLFNHNHIAANPMHHHPSVAKSELNGCEGLNKRPKLVVAGQVLTYLECILFGVHALMSLINAADN